MLIRTCAGLNLKISGSGTCSVMLKCRADIFQAATRDVLRLGIAVLIAKRLPDLPAFEFALADLPRELEHMAIAGSRLADLSFDDLAV